MLRDRSHRFSGFWAQKQDNLQYKANSVHPSEHIQPYLLVVDVVANLHAKIHICNKKHMSNILYTKSLWSSHYWKL